MKFKVNQSVRSQWSSTHRLQRNATPLQSWQQPVEFHNAFKNLRAEWSISLILSRCLSQPNCPQRADWNARKNIGEFTSTTFYSPLSHHTQVLGVLSATSQFILPFVDFERQPSALHRCEVACIVSLWLNTGGLLLPTQLELRARGAEKRAFCLYYSHDP